MPLPNPSFNSLTSVSGVYSSTLVGFGFWFPSNPETRYYSHKSGDPSGDLAQRAANLFMRGYVRMSRDKAIPISVYCYESGRLLTRLQERNHLDRRQILRLLNENSFCPLNASTTYLWTRKGCTVAASATSIETPIQPAVAPNPADDLNSD